MSSIDNEYSNQAAALSDFALSELQLRHQPFTADPNSGEMSGETFVDDIAEAQLDDIKQALISGDDLLLILGPEGSGKSTLLNQLGAKSGQRIQCFSVRGSDRFSTANLFAGMLEAFKKPPPDDLKLMLDELIPCLQGMADHNTLGAVVLDADLPYSSLAIDAFDKERSAAYLDYRLQQAGLSDDFPFNDKEIASINEQAGGRPGQLHTVAAQHLNTRDQNVVHELPPELKEQKKKAAGDGLFAKIGGTKLLVGACALAMIFAGMFWLKPNTIDVPDDRYKVVENKKLNTDQKAQAQQLAQERKAAEKRAAEKLAADKLAAQELAAEKLAAQNEANQPSPAQTNSDTQASNNTTDKNGVQTSGTTDNAATIAANAQSAKAEAQRQAKLERDAAQKAAADKLAEEKLAADKLAVDNLAVDNLAVDKEEKTAQAKLAEASNAAQKVEAAAANAATVEQTPDKPAAAETETNNQSALNNLESPNWVLVQDPALFTVQMSASKDRKSVESFLARTGLEPPNSIFSFNRNGATWFALIHGLYNNIEEARQDIEKMPESTRSNQPWIRAVGRIQKAMKEQ